MIHVKVAVPGMEEKDLKINFEDGLLTVSGERQFERREDRNDHRIECAYGSFVRTFNLPRSVDPSKIVANYRNGGVIPSRVDGEGSPAILRGGSLALLGMTRFTI